MAVNSMGTTFQFTPSGGAQAAVGQLKSISAIKPKAKLIDVTTLDATGGWRSYLQGARDAGEIELEGYFLDGDAGQTALRAAFATGAAGACVVTFTDGTTASFSAIVTGYSVGAAEVDGAIGFSATLAATGAVTFA